LSEITNKVFDPKNEEDEKYIKIYMDLYERFLHDPFLVDKDKENSDYKVVRDKMREIESFTTYEEIIKLR
jgi:hypothetical protein